MPTLNAILSTICKISTKNVIFCTTKTPSSPMAKQISRNEGLAVERRIANITNHLITPSHSRSSPAITSALASSREESSYRRIHGEVETREAEWSPATCNDDVSAKEFTDIIYEKAVGEGIAKVRRAEHFFLL